METRRRSPNGVTILIAEDSPTQAEHLAHMLGVHGYQVVVTRDGNEALTAARAQRPTLIISDIIMPNVDGYALCRAIKADPVLQDIPVVLVTTLTDPQDVIRGLECGVDNFIRKPYEERYLLALIDYLLANTRRHDSQRMQTGVEISLRGSTYLITTARQQLLDILLSTYEQAVDLSQEIKAREKEISRSNQLVSGLYRLAQGLNRAATEQEVADVAIQQALEIPGVQSGWIFLLDEQGDYRLAATGNVRPETQIPLAMPADCECQRAAFSNPGQAVYIAHCPYLDNAPNPGHASIPLWLGERTLGIMNLVGARETVFSDEQLRIFHGVGNQVAVALDRARLHERLESLVMERTSALSTEIEERKKVEAAQARMIAILEATTDFVVMTDANAKPVYINASGRSMLGLAVPEDVQTTAIADYVVARERNRLATEIIPAALRDGIWAGETVMIARDGHEVPVSQVVIAHRDADGTAQYLSTIARDISQHRLQEQHIMRLNRVYAVLSGVNSAIVRISDRQELFDEVCRIAVTTGNFRMATAALITADGQLTPVARYGVDDNFIEAFSRSIGQDYTAKWAALVQTLRNRIPIVLNDLATDPVPRRWRKLSIARGYRALVALPIVQGDKTIGVLALYASEPNVFDPEEIRLLTEIGGDLTFALDHLEKEAKLNYLAYYDALTGLPNRTLLYERLSRLLHQTRRGAIVAVAVLDLERFRFVNETFDRATGDDLLKWAGAQLASVMRDTDVLARLDADCFALAITDCDDSDDVARYFDQRILSAFKQPFAVNGDELHIATRAGIALFPFDGSDADTLVRNAEAALKKAKVAAERSLFYSAEFNASVAEALSLENKLRRALERRELSLYYQPKINLTTGRISGLEALMRWNDPELGMVPPSTFIPIMEDTGMIIEAGRWALEQAAADARHWFDQGLSPLRVAVNVSSIQLRHKDFDGMIGAVLDAARPDELAIDNLIDLEITESIVMQDVEANIRKLTDIRAMGVEVAVDDFGTGYSSLSHITRLPINTLKIDRGFIANMVTKPDDLNIVSTIIILARSMNLKTVAEGVETREQAILLRRLKCDHIQGYLFSPAVTAERIGEMLREGQTLSMPN
ncbi:MAG: EAL domain-containing protein [Porticoccaceae bacterium]